jgi:hypothetical protein
MIRIQINNALQKKHEYELALTDLVASRVSVLRQSLSHLNGVAVDFTTGDFVSFKAVTRHIVDVVGDTINIPNGRPAYTNAINNYRANANNLGNINIAGLIQLCDDLLANNEQQLQNLLVEDAPNLINLNTAVLNNHGVNTPLNIEIIKLAFDYQRYDEIATAIKIYFRGNNFTKFCSYCNAEPVTHQTNIAGQVVRSYELDHFYDKSRHPLLAYCLFNLVPSDHHCNVTNKGATQFTDQYHLNPHYMGYADRISFTPIGITTAYEVSNIEVGILEVQGTALYRQMNGNNQPNEEQGDLGNLNVFRIRSKYSDKLHRASTILKLLHNENTYFKHLKKYLKNLNGLDRKNNYMKWYEKELDVQFNSIDFNDKAFSKFSRDIHDYYFQNNKTRWNRYILELINA